MTDFVHRVLPGAAVHKLPYQGHFTYLYFCDECHRQIFTTLFGTPQGPLSNNTEADLNQADDKMVQQEDIIHVDVTTEWLTIIFLYKGELPCTYMVYGVFLERWNCGFHVLWLVLGCHRKTLLLSSDRDVDRSIKINSLVLVLEVGRGVQVPPIWTADVVFTFVQNLMYYLFILSSLPRFLWTIVAKEIYVPSIICPVELLHVD